MRAFTGVVCITGASSGIGAACARIFAEFGARLILCARREAKLQVLADELRDQFDSQILTLILDVTDKTSVAQLANLPEDYKNIDVLINNAGMAFGTAPTQAGSLEGWDQMIDTNVKGLLYVTRTLLPNMLARNRGHIINIGSIAGHEVYPGGNVYCATKHAVKALTQSLRIDILGSQVRVSSVDPGMVETEFSQVRFAGDTKKAEAVYQGFEALQASDIADAVHYCATRPSHVNIAEVIVMPTAQASAIHVHRESN